MRVLLMLAILVSCGQNPVVNKDRTLCELENRVDGQYIVCGDFEFNASYTNFTIVELCPEINGQFNEVLLYLNGQYMSYFSNTDYKKQRLAVLDENVNLSSTDGRNVFFRIVGRDIIYSTPGCANYLGE